MSEVVTMLSAHKNSVADYATYVAASALNLASTELIFDLGMQ
jgi:hypothetical protein